MRCSRNRRAARTVASAEHIPLPSRRVLLKMLGLLDETGRGIAPDPPEDAPDAGLPYVSSALSGMAPVQSRLTTMYDLPRERYVDRLPPGLRAMPTPEQAQAQAKAEAKAAAQREPRPPKAAAPRPNMRNGELAPPTPGPQCGQSLGGRSRHVRLGEALCDTCRDYFNEYQRSRVAKRKAQRKAGRVSHRKPRPACGTPFGAKAHRIRGEQICEPCLEARRVYNRARWHQLTESDRERINTRRLERKAERRAVEADIAKENAEQGPQEAAS